jgi:hypothetical protein
MAAYLTFLVYLFVFTLFVSSLQVTPGSQCAAVCLDNPENDPLDPASSSTNVSDITCNDSSYADSSRGVKFKNCLDCLQQSRAVKDAESDVRWFLCKAYDILCCGGTL